MSNSCDTEVELEKLADKLRGEADDLDRAREVLEALRESKNHKEEINRLKSRVKDWMRP